MTLRRSLAWVVVASLLPVLALSAVLMGVLDRTQRRETRGHVLRTVRALSEAIDGELRVSLAALDVLAHSPLLDEQRLPAYYETLRGTAARLGWIGAALADQSGQQILNLSRPLGAPLPSSAKRDFVQEVLRTGRPVISNLIVTQARRNPAVIVAVPVRRDDAVRFVLMAALGPERLHALLLAQPVPPGWRWGLNDRRQVIITSTSAPNPYTGQAVSENMARESARAREGWFPNVSREGIPTYSGFYTSPLSGWLTVAIVPRAAIDGPSNRALGAMVGGAALLVGAGVLAALWVGGRLARDVDAFRAVAVAMRRGGTPSLPPARVRELRVAREALHDTARLLETQRAERAAILTRAQHARVEADRANRAKDEFLATLSHELRNPLAAIAGAAAVLQRVGKPDDAATTALGIVDRQVKHLRDLVDDLLDVARVTSGKIRLDQRLIDLGQLVQRTVQSFLAGGRAMGHAPQVTVEPVWVHADETRMEQVVSNLLGNAVKFTPPGGAIQAVVRRDGPTAVLEVRDSGRGISADLLPRVFELFVQGETAADRAHGGLGLGLPLASRLVEMHGGTVEAESEGLGRGATFRMRLPAIPAPVQVPDAPSTPVVPSRRILVIDDQEDAREALRAVLMLDGHEVIAAADGVAGIESARAFLPDVIIVDIGLPGIDGYEVARRLRASDLPFPPRLVALTGYGQPDDRRRAEGAGIDAHLVKPASPEDLRAAIAAR